METSVKDIDYKVFKTYFPEIYSIDWFRKWFDFVYPATLPLRESNLKLSNNFSEITFAFHLYPDKKIGKKVAIGTGDQYLTKEIKDYFFVLIRDKCRQAYDWFLDIVVKRGEPTWVGLGIEYKPGEGYFVKAYIGYQDIYGATCKDGKLLEKKVYKYDREKDTMVVSGKHKREQINIELKGAKALLFLKWLLDKGYITQDFYEINKKMINEDYSLDTLSVSKTRGIAIYYE
jgi:hypothetical protein